MQYLFKKSMLQYTKLFKNLGSVNFFFLFKEINTFIQEGCVKWINAIVKTYIVWKDIYSEQMQFFFFVFIKASKKKVSRVPKNMKQHNSINTHNKSAY